MNYSVLPHFTDTASNWTRISCFLLPACIQTISSAGTSALNISSTRFDILVPIGSMYGIYANIFGDIGGILMGSMLPYIAGPWILWGLRHLSGTRRPLEPRVAVCASPAALCGNCASRLGNFWFGPGLEKSDTSLSLSIYLSIYEK